MIRWWGRGRDGKSLKKFWILIEFWSNFNYLNPIILSLIKKSCRSLKIHCKKLKLPQNQISSQKSIKIPHPCLLFYYFYNSKAASISQDFFSFILFLISFFTSYKIYKLTFFMSLNFMTVLILLLFGIL